MQHQESPVRARLREALLQKLLGTGLVRNDPAVQTAARTEVNRLLALPRLMEQDLAGAERRIHLLKVSKHASGFAPNTHPALPSILVPLPRATHAYIGHVCRRHNSGSFKETSEKPRGRRRTARGCLQLAAGQGVVTAAIGSGIRTTLDRLRTGAHRHFRKRRRPCQRRGESTESGPGSVNLGGRRCQRPARCVCVCVCVCFATLLRRTGMQVHI